MQTWAHDNGSRFDKELDVMWSIGEFHRPLGSGKLIRQVDGSLFPVNGWQERYPNRSPISNVYHDICAIKRMAYERKSRQGDIRIREEKQRRDILNEVIKAAIELHNERECITFRDDDGYDYFKVGKCGRAVIRARKMGHKLLGTSGAYIHILDYPIEKIQEYSYLCYQSPKNARCYL